MNKVGLKYFKTVFCVFALAFCIFAIYSRYQYVNAFYLEYKKGHEKTALDDFWTGPGVTIQDLRAAGVEHVSSSSDDPNAPKGYRFEIEKSGLQYRMSYGVNDTVVNINRGDDDSKSTVISVSASPKYKKEDLVESGEASKKQLIHYRKFSYNFMQRIQKQTYEYWQKDKTLRYKKMIPFYEYLRKN